MQNFIILLYHLPCSRVIEENAYTVYHYFCRTSVIKGSWKKLEGTFSLSAMPDRVIFYLEGPAPGVDLLIRSVEINCSNSNDNVCHVVIYFNYCYGFVQFFILESLTLFVELQVIVLQWLLFQWLT